MRARAIIAKAKHRIAHWLGWNCGQVESWTANNGKVMIGFRCECGKLSGVHPSLVEYDARDHDSRYP